MTPKTEVRILLVGSIFLCGGEVACFQLVGPLSGTTAVADHAAGVAQGGGAGAAGYRVRFATAAALVHELIEA